MAGRPKRTIRTQQQHHILLSTLLLLPSPQPSIYNIPLQLQSHGIWQRFGQDVRPDRRDTRFERLGRGAAVCVARGA